MSHSTNDQKPSEESGSENQYSDRKDASKKEIFIYSLGGTIDELTTSGFRNLNTLLVIAFQLNPLIVGLIGAVKTIWDGIADPIIAHWSDNCNSRWGRRRPFILAGGVLMAFIAWFTWQFMPENEKLRPNDPVIPQVYFADEQWKGLGDLLLAYGVTDFDVGVEVEVSPEVPIQQGLIKTFAAEAIKKLGGDTKALVSYRSSQANLESQAKAENIEIPHYTLKIRALKASAEVLEDTQDSVALPFMGALEIILEKEGSKQSFSTVVNFEAGGVPTFETERIYPIVEKIAYFLIGFPEENKLALSTPHTQSQIDIFNHRADERSIMAAIKLGVTELFAQEFGLPYWRIFPESTVVQASLKETVRGQATQILGMNPYHYQRLLLSAGVKIKTLEGQLSTEEQALVEQYFSSNGYTSSDDFFEKTYETLDVGVAASYQTLIRDPLKTRQFKGIWEKIGDGLKSVASENSQERKFMWFVMAMFVFMAIGSTLYNAAYYAQGIEIAPSYNGRTLVVAYRQVANAVINIVTQLFLPLSLMPIFLDAREGSLFLVYVLSPMGLILALTVFFGTKERTVIIRDKNKKPSFFKAVKEIGGIWEFWRITLLYLFMGYAMGSFAGLGNLIAVYYIFDGNMLIGASYGSIAGTLGTVCAMLSIPLIVVLCKRLGKHNALRLALASLAIASVLKYFCYNPDMPWLLFIPPLFYSPAIAGFYNILSTMMGDVTDLDELRNGERREGMFGAVMAIIMKFMGSFTAVASGAVIVLSGFEIEKGIHQDPGVFHTMLILFSIVPGVVSIIGFALLARFKLTSERVDEIKQQLAIQREAKAKANASVGNE